MSSKLIICLLSFLLVTACSESKEELARHHAIQREACAEVSKDDLAYRIDEALTASAPWNAGSFVAENFIADYYSYRRFWGVTQSGYYLVQDFYCNDPNSLKSTDPFLVMNEYAVSQTGWEAACGAYVFWSRRGIKVEEGAFLYGVKEGEWAYWSYGDGSLHQKGRYENGLKQGYWVSYWSGNPQKMFEHFYVNGMQEGPSFAWHENGQLRSFVFMHHNKQQGLLTTWDQNGRVIGQVIFNDDEKVGIWSKWDSQGHLISENNYN